MICIRFCSVALLMACGFGAATCSSAQDDDTVIAIVDDARIYQSQVDHEFRTRFANRNVDQVLESGIRKRITDRLINQQLILIRFGDSDIKATEDEIDLELSRIRESLEQTDRTLADHLRDNQLSMAAFRFNLRWQISWKRYLDKTLTDQVLERYFQRYHRQFDGTQVRVAHILWQPAESASIESLVKSAQQVRQSLLAGEITWAQAVARHSAGSSQNEGDTGWINYTGPMSRSFTDAALALEVGQISEPVTTPFGVHLIKATDLRPGTTPWYDVAAQIRLAATQELFELLANKQKPESRIQRFPAVPAATDGDR